MKTHPFVNSKLNPQEVIKNITLRRIMQALPGFEHYKPFIKFSYEGKAAKLDLSLLPNDVAKKIEALFS